MVPAQGTAGAIQYLPLFDVLAPVPCHRDCDRVSIDSVCWACSCSPVNSTGQDPFPVRLAALAQHTRLCRKQRLSIDRGAGMMAAMGTDGADQILVL